jgi:hypothetical protein
MSALNARFPGQWTQTAKAAFELNLAEEAAGKQVQLKM